jgi:hypothetical protein
MTVMAQKNILKKISYHVSLHVKFSNQSKVFILSDFYSMLNLDIGPQSHLCKKHAEYF